MDWDGMGERRCGRGQDGEGGGFFLKAQMLVIQGWKVAR